MFESWLFSGGLLILEGTDYAVSRYVDRKTGESRYPVLRRMNKVMEFSRLPAALERCQMDAETAFLAAKESATPASQKTLF